jgi:uncharacterized protein with PIN domain
MQRRRKPQQAAKSTARKVKFLREHPLLWCESDREIVRALKSAGLLARGTHYTAVATRSLLREAQTVRPVRVPRPRCPTCNQVLPRVPHATAPEDVKT